MNGADKYSSVAGEIVASEAEATPLDTDDPLERHFDALSITPTALLQEIARFRTTI